jgi:hypothetical protein
MTTALDTLRKPTNWTAINWPVFRLGERQPIVAGGLVFYRTEYTNPDDNTYSDNYQIVDDKNINKPTLGLRRLVIKDKLFRISSAIYFIGDVIKLAKATTWFIDSHGQVFQHKKSTRAKLATHRLKQVLPASGLGCILEVEGLVERFKSLQVPKPEEQYCGILSYGHSNLLYGYYSEPIKTTWRMV